MFLLFGAGDAEFIHEFVDGGAAEAEFGGGGGDFARVFAQGLGEHLSFDGFAGFFEGDEAGVGGGGGQFEVAGGDAAAFGHDDSAADAVFQFADIAGPGVFVEGADGIGIKDELRFVNLGDEMVEKELSEEADIVFAVAKGREGDLDDGEPIE